MTDKKSLREHLRNGNLYVSRLGPVAETWKQRLLAQFALERSLKMSLNPPTNWRIVAAICLPLCFVFFGLTWLNIADPVQLLERATTLISETSSDLDAESGMYIAVLITTATFLWRGRLPSTLDSF